MRDSGQLLLLGVLLVFAVLVFTRGRRQQREAQTTQAGLRAGAEVMMTSGLYGTIVEVTDDGFVRLETSPGTVSRWDRRAVARIVSAPELPQESAAPELPRESTEPRLARESTEPELPREGAEPAPSQPETAPPDRA